MSLDSPRIVVTGASGFIGSALVSALGAKYPVLAISRVPTLAFSCTALLSDLLSAEPGGVVGKFAPTHLIHCAALAHRKYPRTDSALAYLRAVNVLLPVTLASVSLRLGIRRFVFLSSVGVHGSSTVANAFFDEASPLCPANPYSASKLAAELGIRRLLEGSSCEYSIIRPALVYGRGMPGNFRALVNAIDLGLPFPLASIKNRRSFISIDNLVSAIEAVALHPMAASQVYLAADEELISTADLICCVARVRNRRPLLLSFPPRSLSALARLPFVGVKIGQLVDDLVVDSTKLRCQLDWSQPTIQLHALQKAFALS